MSSIQKDKVICLLREYEEPFPDVQTKTTAAEHDVIITTNEPIRQHLYCLNPIKLKYLRGEIN